MGAIAPRRMPRGWCCTKLRRRLGTALVAATVLTTAAAGTATAGAPDAVGVTALAADSSAPAVPTTWTGVDRLVLTSAPDVHELVASVDGNSCTTIHAIAADVDAPLGSEFKLYVLDALARQIAAKKVAWGQELTVTGAVKSLPSGTLQDRPDGSKVTVQQAATDMIADSDNTAADLLAELLGPSAIEGAARQTGIGDLRLDLPFLTTHEAFVLKLDDWPHLADQYLGQNSSAARSSFLAKDVDPKTINSQAAVAWTQPRDIDRIEWFASPDDICRVYASLLALSAQPGLAPVATIMDRNDGGLHLDPRTWRPPWFKGGSEPGVLTISYLATTTAGRHYLVSLMAESPTRAINQTPVTLRLLSAAAGALLLAAR